MENEVKKSKKGLVMAIIAILLIAIIAGLAYYFLRPISPKEVFISQINEAVNESNKLYDTQNEKINSSIALTGNIETTNSKFAPIAQYINDGKLDVNIQADTQSKKILLTTNIDYKNQKLLGGKVFYQKGDKNIYLFIQDLYDKYFKINIDDVVNDEEITNAVTNSDINLKEASKILISTIEENLKDEYFSQEKVEDMTKNTIRMTTTELADLSTKVITSLKNNESYLACFGNREEIVNGLEEALDEIEDLKEDYENMQMEVSLYTKGIVKKLQKTEINIAKSEKEQATLTINKIDENKAEFKLDVREIKDEMPVNAEVLKGTITRENVDENTEKYVIVTDNIPNFGKVTLNMEIKNQKETEIDSVNVSDSVKIEEMTQLEMIKLYTNLTKMQIYPLIAPFLGNIE